MLASARAHRANAPTSRALASRARRAHHARRAQLLDSTDQSTEYTIRMTTEEARKCIKWDALVVGDNERAIFVAGVARESDCERAGVVPGQRLRALTAPVGDADKLWIISDTERLAFVNDAIRSTRAEEITFVLEKEITVTQEMVAAAMSEEERAEEEAREARAKAKNETPTRSRDANGKRIEDRPDLYTENWEGDQFVGKGFWNELTVGLAVAIVVPLVITVLATTTRGVLWDVTRF